MKSALLIVSGVILGLAVACVQAIPPAEAQTVQEAGGGPAVVMGIGGSAANQNDNCWVLFKEKAKNREGKDVDRVTLCLYRLLKNGQAFDLMDVREITYDAKLSQLNHNEHNKDLDPKLIKKKYEEQLKREEEEARQRLREQQAQQNR
jgi:hypothetical protein